MFKAELTYFGPGLVAIKVTRKRFLAFIGLIRYNNSPKNVGNVLELSMNVGGNPRSESQLQKVTFQMNR